MELKLLLNSATTNNSSQLEESRQIAYRLWIQQSLKIMLQFHILNPKRFMFWQILIQ